MIWGTLGEVRDGLGTLPEVQNGSRDPRGGLGWVGGPTGRSGTRRGTLGEVQDGSEDPPKGLERVG